MLGCIDGTNFPVIFTIIELVVMALATMSTPIQHFDLRGDWQGKKPCYTLWGYKSDCGSIKYDATGTAAWECAHRRNNIMTGAVFAVVSVVLSVTVVVLGILMVCNCFRSLLIPLVGSIATSVTLLISWVCVCSVYTTSMCGGANYKGSKFSATTKYAAGFYLLVTAFAVQIVNLVFVVLMIFL